MTRDNKSIILLADTIQGEINRMCVTNNLNELDTMYSHANTNLDNLLSMIYKCRFNTEKQEQAEIEEVLANANRNFHG